MQLPRVSIVAAQAVNFELAGDVLPHDLYFVVGLSRTAARCLPAEDFCEFAVGQAKLSGFECARPGAIRKRYLRAGFGININPWLARPAGLGIRIDRVKMPALFDDPVAVTLAACPARGKRQ